MELTISKLMPWNELNSNGFFDIKVGEKIEVGDTIAYPTSSRKRKSEYFFSKVRMVTKHGIYLMNRQIRKNGFIPNGTDVKIKK